MSSKKYHTHVEQNGDHWTAQIVRQVTKHKTHVSKQQGDFSSEADANAWAEDALGEFVNKQQQANARQGSQRKETEEIRRQRSERRAEKTEIAKLNKEKEREQELAAQTNDLAQE